ncbi:hypothetical protein [Nannocystis pusilla]|uniref:hypothetical protein n=1 Tax=Nannocystis pusilla TaxID=889268 RepID=UPI003B7E222E
MEQVADSVLSGSAQINAAIQTYDVSTRDWLVNNVETGGVYECLPSPTDMFSALELLNPKNISDAIKSRFGLK